MYVVQFPQLAASASYLKAQKDFFFLAVRLTTEKMRKVFTKQKEKKNKAQQVEQQTASEQVRKLLSDELSTRCTRSGR